MFYNFWCTSLLPKFITENLIHKLIKFLQVPLRKECIKHIHISILFFKQMTKTQLTSFTFLNLSLSLHV